jgi:hypothetical protein
VSILFGDVEPEDAWDRGDSTDLLIANLIARAILLERRWVRVPGDDPAATLDALAALVAVARRRRLTGRDLVRADELDADIVYLRGRL